MSKFPPIIANAVFPGSRLTPLAPAEDYVSPSGRHIKQWLCRCECDNTTIVTEWKLKNGHTKSCGCLAREVSILNGKARSKQNEYDLNGKYGIGYTFKGEEFYFDLEDYELIKDYCWYKQDGYILARNKNKGKGNILFSRLIMNSPEGLQVDHRNGHRYDNRKENLRVCTQSQNAMNRKTNNNNVTGHKGVVEYKNSWRAYISCNNKHYSKSFSTNKYPNAYELACEWYDQMAQELFGEYNRDNSNV